MSEFNYQEKGTPKLSPEFRKQFIVMIGRTEAIKVDGLIALANEKGVKSMKTKIIQFPTDQNKWTCIATTNVIGYDWNPVTQKIEEVEYEDFADANEANCGSMTKSSYIRMASTRSVGRTLRKYTSINMVCSDELSNSVDNVEKMIDTNELVVIRNLVTSKHLTPEEFGKIMAQKYGHTNYQGLTEKQGEELIKILEAVQSKPAPVPVQQMSTPAANG